LAKYTFLNQSKNSEISKNKEQCHLQNSVGTIRLQTQASHSTNVEGTLRENAARLGAGGMAARSNRWPSGSETAALAGAAAERHP
jgi:hypothetical protein